MKQRHHHHRRITILMSRHHMEALQSSYARGSAVMHARAYARRYTRENTAQTKAEQSTNMHRLVCLGIFGSCSDCSLSACYLTPAMVRTQMYIWHHINPASYDVNVDPHSTPPNCTTRPSCSVPTPPQRSQPNPKRSSVGRLTRVSNCPRKAIAPTAHMGRSGSGTSLG